MRVKVTLMGELAKYCGLRTVQLELEDEGDLSRLLTVLDQHTNQPVAPVVVTPGGLISSHYSIMRNGSNVLLSSGLATRLADGDEITLVPKVAGGEGRLGRKTI